MQETSTHHTTQTRTNNVNRTWAIPQTTRGKDESKIVFIPKSQRTSLHGTQHVKTDNRTTQNTKQMSNTDPTKQLMCSRRASRSSGQSSAMNTKATQTRLRWSHRYKHSTVVITIWLTVTRYSYLKWQWMLYFLRRSFLTLHPWYLCRYCGNKLCKFYDVH
jgi:hypothetical protein